MNNIILIEDHHQALDAWRKLEGKNLPLVHLDAHIDFGFYRANPPAQIIKEARSLAEIKRQLELSLLYKKYRPSFEEQLNIGNYIYPAMRDGIVSAFYWIIPGKNPSLRKELKRVKKIIHNLKKSDPHGKEDLRLDVHLLSAPLYNKPFAATNLFSMAKIDRPILLDIDVDFLLFDSLGKTSLMKKVGTRKPWFYPQALVALIKEKFAQPVCITVAYSVNGGFSPIEYKFFGDEIALRLTSPPAKETESIFSLRNHGIAAFFKGNYPLAAEYFEEAISKLSSSAGLEKINSRFFAHLYFWLYKIYWKLNYKKLAKECYLKVLKADPSYRVKDNNLGPLYRQKGDTKNALKEFSQILYCDPKDYFALIGMGDIFMRQRKRKKALAEYEKALKIRPTGKEALAGLVNLLISSNQLIKAKKILAALKEQTPSSGNSYFLEARLQKKLGEFGAALSAYKEALVLGPERIEIYQDVFGILKKKGESSFMEFFRQKYIHFRKYLFHSQKKRLVKENKSEQLQRLGKSMKKIDQFLSNG